MQEMPSTLREIRDYVFSLNSLMVWVSVSVICIIVDPFNTKAFLSTPAFIAYWFAINAAAMIIGPTVMIAMSRDELFSFSRTIRMALGAIVCSILILLAIWLIQKIFFENPPDLLPLMKIVFPISLIISVVTTLVSIRMHNRTEQVHNGGETTEIAFFKRLPVHLGKDLHYLSVQDHYVNAVTAKGSQMVLMRFSDALTELENVDGLQVHRSHWVAKGAVRSTRRSQGKLLLEMPDGSEIPVSRSYLKAVKEALRID